MAQQPTDSKAPDDTSGLSRKDQAIREYEERKGREAHLAEQNAVLFGKLADLEDKRGRELKAKDVMIDVLMNRIEQLVAAPHPVTALPDGRVILSDGSVYVEVWARPEGWTGDEDDSVTVWQERDPLPRTRRAIADEIAKDDDATRRARAGASERDCCVPTEVLEDQAEYRRGTRGTE